MTEINVTDSSVVSLHRHRLPCCATKVNIIIHESTDKDSWGTIGKFTRKARKHTYVSPRLLLPRDYSEHIGKTVKIYKAKLSVEGLGFLEE